MSRDFEHANVTDHIDIGTWSISGSAVTLAVWCRLESFSQSDARIFSKATGSGEQDHVLMVSTQSGSQLRLRLKTGTSNSAGTTTLISASVLALDVWFPVVIRYDGTDMTIFKDGIQIATRGKTGALRENNWSAFWGNNPSNQRRLDGALAEGVIWDVPLTNNEIAAYSNGFSPAQIRPENLQSYLPMDGIDAPEPDYSGLGRNGTVVGALRADHPPVFPRFEFNEYSGLFLGGGGAGPTLISIAETGSGAEGLSITNSAPITENGAGLESAQIDAAVPIAETVNSTETSTISAGISQQDTGSSVDSLTANANVPVSDNTSGLESQTINAEIPIPESGSGTDVPTVAAPGVVSIADTGSATETIALRIDLNVSDTAIGADEIALAASVSIIESGAGAETALVNVSLAMTEIANGLDTVQLLVAIGLAETSPAVDAVTVDQGAGFITITDVAIGNEALTITAALAIAESATGLDTTQIDTGLVAAIIRMTAVALTVPRMSDVALTVPKMASVELIV